MNSCLSLQSIPDAFTYTFVGDISVTFFNLYELLFFIEVTFLCLILIFGFSIFMHHRQHVVELIRPPFEVDVFLAAAFPWL